MAEERQPEHVERSWPSDAGDHPVAELVAHLQGADTPFGEVELPLPLERHGRQWVIRKPGTERHDTDFGGDEAI